MPEAVWSVLDPFFNNPSWLSTYAFGRYQVFVAVNNATVPNGNVGSRIRLITWIAPYSGPVAYENI
jgi:hypothetical protein